MRKCVKLCAVSEILFDDTLMYVCVVSFYVYFYLIRFTLNLYSTVYVIRNCVDYMWYIKKLCGLCVVYYKFLCLCYSLNIEL